MAKNYNLVKVLMPSALTVALLVIVLWQMPLNDNVILLSLFINIAYLIIHAIMLFRHKKELIRKISILLFNLSLTLAVIGFFHQTLFESLQYSAAYYSQPEFRKKIRHYNNFILNNSLNLHKTIHLPLDSINNNQITVLSNVKEIHKNDGQVFFYFHCNHPTFEGIVYSKRKERAKHTGKNLQQIWIWKRITKDWYYWAAIDPY